MTEKGKTVEFGERCKTKVRYEAQNLNIIPRYYGNKNILKDFNEVFNFTDGTGYEEKVLLLLMENAESLLIALREKYLKEISH